MGNAVNYAITPGGDPHAARHKEFDKPGSDAAQIIAAIQNPETSAELRSIFEKFDKDHSNGLDLQEWRAFGKYLYEADVEKPLEQGEKEVLNFVVSVLFSCRTDCSVI